MSSSSDIRVSVQWKSAAVFAGESIDCIITFKNVAQLRRRSPSPNPLSLRKPPAKHVSSRLPSNNGGGGGLSRRGSETTITTSQVRVQGLRSPLSAGERKGSASSIASSVVQQGGDTGNEVGGGTSKEGKRRSVSIMSIGSNVLEELASQSQNQGQSTKTTWTKNGHSRATSMQMPPRRNGSYGGQISSPGTLMRPQLYVKG